MLLLHKVYTPCLRGICIPFFIVADFLVNKEGQTRSGFQITAVSFAVDQIS